MTSVDGDTVRELADWLTRRADCVAEPGLTEVELDRAEDVFGLRFPPLWRRVLALVHPTARMVPPLPPGAAPRSGTTYPDWRRGGSTVGADAEIFLFDYDRYRDQVVPALTELLRSGSVVPWLGAVFESATPMGAYGYDVLWTRLAERLREQPVDVARDWTWLGSDLRYVGERPYQRALGRHVGRPWGDGAERESGPLPQPGEPVAIEELNALHEALVALYCLGPGQFLGRSVTPDFYRPVLDGQGVGAGDPVRGLLAALGTRGAVLGDQFGVTEGIHGWLDVPETAELAVRLGRLELPRYEPTLAAMTDHAKRGGDKPGEWREWSLSFVRTTATIAAGDGRAVLWGNDVSPDTWRRILGIVA